jgi:hypothetical protein
VRARGNEPHMLFGTAGAPVDPMFPLFPSSFGGFVAKEAMADTLKAAATLVGPPTQFFKKAMNFRRPFSSRHWREVARLAWRASLLAASTGHMEVRVRVEVRVISISLRTNCLAPSERVRDASRSWRE